LENDECYINALVPTGISVGAVAAGAGIAAYVIDQNNQATAPQQQPAVQIIQSLATQYHNAVNYPALQQSWAEPTLVAWNLVMALAPCSFPSLKDF
jgi:hypothetical protein